MKWSPVNLKNWQGVAYNSNPRIGPAKQCFANIKKGSIAATLLYKYDK